MPQKTTAELLNEVASIASNGANAITGNQLGKLLTNIIESVVNTSTNSIDLATNSYRTGLFIRPGPGSETVTFSSSIGTTNYKVFFSDPNNIITSFAFNKTVNGFDVSVSDTGQVRYFAVINN